MFDCYPVNPDESLFAAIAWNLWTRGYLGTDLLAGAVPGIEHHVYWTPPLYYVVLAPWLGSWGLSLLSVRSLSLVAAAAAWLAVYLAGRRLGMRHAWMASAILFIDPAFTGASCLGRMDMMAIALTAGAIAVVCGSGLSPRRAAVGGLLASAAALTHPLGLAAVFSGAVTCALAGWRRLAVFAAGCLPLAGLWALYIAADPDAFLAQIGLQLARKEGHPFNPTENLVRFLIRYGGYRYMAASLWVAGLVGLVLHRRALRAWGLAALCLWPAVLLSGELTYAAYLAPATCMGVGALLASLRWGPRLVGVGLAAYLAGWAVSRPPLARIDPGYPAFCADLEARLAPEHTVLLAVMPDPWFALRQRRDLTLRHASPVPISPTQLLARVDGADDIVVGGYNAPGMVGVVAAWDQVGRVDQRLWLVFGTEVHDYRDVRDELGFRGL